MKKIILIIVFIFSLTQIFAVNEIKINGIYQGENIYVMNPFAATGVGFCITEVLVNGIKTTDEIQSNAFEIDLSIHDMEIGDKVEIIIRHKDGCMPEILNPEVIKPRSTFNIETINLSKTGNLRWTTTNESGEIPFTVQQFKWNKWVQVKKIDGKGTPNKNTYTCKVVFHSGENRFRIKQKDFYNKPRYSKEVKYDNPEPPITFTPGNGQKATDKLYFSKITSYEIYDYYGKLQIKDIGKDVDISSLQKGDYFINYDNKTESFIKK